MAQAVDVRNTLADRLWAIFEAQPTVAQAVWPHRRVKGDEIGWLRETIANAPAERRQMSIGFERGRNSLFARRTGFAKEDPEFDADGGCDFDVVRLHVVLITYRESLPRDPGARAVQEAIEQSILLAGPTLGLPDLIPPADGVGELTWDERPTHPREFPNPGRVVTYRLPVTTVQSALALVGQTP